MTFLEPETKNKQKQSKYPEIPNPSCVKFSELESGKNVIWEISFPGGENISMWLADVISFSTFDWEALLPCFFFGCQQNVNCFNYFNSHLIHNNEYLSNGTNTYLQRKVWFAFIYYNIGNFF